MSSRNLESRSGDLSFTPYHPRSRTTFFFLSPPTNGTLSTPSRTNRPELSQLQLLKSPRRPNPLLDPSLSQPPDLYLPLCQLPLLPLRPQRPPPPPLPPPTPSCTSTSSRQSTKATARRWTATSKPLAKADSCRAGPPRTPSPSCETSSGAKEPLSQAHQGHQALKASKVRRLFRVPEALNRSRDLEALNRSQDSEALNRSRDLEAPNRSRDSEALNRSQDSEALNRSQDSEALNRSRDSEAPNLFLALRAKRSAPQPFEATPNLVECEETEPSPFRPTTSSSATKRPTPFEMRFSSFLPLPRHPLPRLRPPQPLRRLL